MPLCEWMEVGPNNPFDARILNVLPVTQTMTSVSKDPEVARRFVELRGSDGTELRDSEITDAQTVSIGLEVHVHNGFVDGPLFKSGAMEEKWDIYAYDSVLYFARSWSGDLIYKAPFAQSGGAIKIESVEVSANHADKVDQTLFFLLTSHVLGQPWPNPIPDEGPSDPNEIALLSYSLFGRKACAATYSDVTDISLLVERESNDR